MRSGPGHPSIKNQAAQSLREITANGVHLLATAEDAATPDPALAVSACSLSAFAACPNGGPDGAAHGFAAGGAGFVREAVEPAMRLGAIRCPLNRLSTTIHVESGIIAAVSYLSCRRAGRLHRVTSSISSRFTFAHAERVRASARPDARWQPGAHT
jgi:hypothetical protein